MEWLELPRWSPYVVGAAIGLLSCLAVLLSDKFLGISTAFARTSGMIARLFAPRSVERNAYYQKFPPQIDWEFMLVVGVALGAFLSAALSNDLRSITVPQRWAEAFGDSVPLRLAVAVFSGILMGFGARWAGGCTSGHGISGTLQLALSSWLAVLCAFVGGILTALLLFGVVTP
ncbi:MAG: YeeE/YedE thiosulfate transporter family protein [Armatimonadota bacterium]